MRKRWLSPCSIVLEIIGIIGVLFMWHAMVPERISKDAAETSGLTSKENGKEYIKWAEFNVSYDALNEACQYDVETYEREPHLNWIELLAYLGTKYGGDFSQYQSKDMEELADKLVNHEATMEELTRKMKYYPYYLEIYQTVLGGMVGTYEIEEPDELAEGGVKWVKKYGLKAYSPIAKGFPYGDYDDFGVSRSYGYKRNHLGHDMMGQVGTPIVAMCSGYVYEIGWNQYGGWRIGISSFDKKSYYYYAHLRQNFPYAKSLKKGDVVQAGDVIGYMGRTGYSRKENVNNIDTSHLHFGLQLIFDESQRQGNHEIWVNCYPLIRFLYQNQSEVIRDDTTKEWSRIYKIRDPQAEKYKKATE